jgi:DNA invertase Pin-like site-specific DNA recombinase
MKETERFDFSYGVYTRKSSEHEDSQVQSIQRQIEELAEVIGREQLSVHGEVLREAKSAFHPGREEFAKLVRMTNEGEINAWLCWHANRLSRNPVDAGTVVYLMDIGKLHHIRTRDRTYFNTPVDKFLLQMEFTMSKKDSDDKSVLVKSGILRRHRRGYPNGAPPVGYIHRARQRSGHSVWTVDEDRFDMVRGLIHRFLEGRDSLTSITAYARAIGLTTAPKNNTGGRPLVRSAVHSRILTNPVYAGYFTGIDGKEYELDVAVPRILRRSEFTKVLQILGDRRATSRNRTHTEATYRGVIRGVAGEYMGPDFKFHLVCDCKAKFSYVTKTCCPACSAEIAKLRSPRYRRYVYYSVVRDRVRPGVRVRAVEERRIDRFVMENLILPLRISPELRDWAVAHLELLHDRDLKDRRAEAKEVEAMRALLVRKKERLRELLLNGIITEAEYREDLSKVQAELAMDDDDMPHYRSDWLADAKRVLNLAVEAYVIMEKGDSAEKRQALLDLCSNLFWDGEKLSISNAKRVNVLIEALKSAKRRNPMFEPSIWVDTQGSNAVFADVRPELLTGVDALRTFFQGCPQGKPRN